jgi:hypothetical protein
MENYKNRVKLRALLVLSIIILMMTNCFGQEMQVIILPSDCQEYKLYYKKTANGKVKVRYYSLLEGKEVDGTIKNSSELNTLSLKLSNEVNFSCSLSNFSSSDSNQCITKASLSDQFDLSGMDISSVLVNNLCSSTYDLTQSKLVIIKYTLFGLFFNKNYAQIKEAKRSCPDLSEEYILLNYAHQKSYNLCAGVGSKKDLFFLLKSDLKKYKNLKKGKKKRNFQALNKKFDLAIATNVLINEFKKSYEVTPPVSLISKFKTSLGEFLNSKEKSHKGLANEVMNKYIKEIASNYIDSFASESFISNNLMAKYPGTEDIKSNLTDYQKCLGSSKMKSDSISSYVQLTNQLKGKCTNGKCKNYCNDNEFSKRSQCLRKLNSNIKKKSVDKLIRKIEAALGSIDKVKAKVYIDECIDSRSNINKCIDNYSSKLYKDQVRSQVSELNSFLFNSDESSEQVELAIQDCINALVENSSADKIKVCTQIISYNDAAKELSLKLKDDKYKEINAKLTKCLGSVLVHACLSKALDEVQSLQLLTNDTDKKAVALSLSFDQLLKDGVKSSVAFEMLLSQVSDLIRPTYERNPDAMFCTRKMRNVHEIIFHHTAMDQTGTAQKVNRMHVKRSDDDDQWLMIGYNFLIRDDKNSDDIGNTQAFEGRPVDHVGAHAGAQAYSKELTAEQRVMMKEDGYRCSRSKNNGGQWYNSKPSFSGGQIKANRNSVGIAFMGNYWKKSVSNPGGYPVNNPRYPGDGMLRKAAQISCSLQKQYPSIKKFGWHNLVNSDTACPGLVKERINLIVKYAKEYGCAFTSY